MRARGGAVREATALDTELDELVGLTDRETVLVDESDLAIHDRPTKPVPPPPFESGVRLGATVISVVGATVDIVTADLTRDPRSEDFVGSLPPPPQNERPPSTSMVRALK